MSDQELEMYGIVGEMLRSVREEKGYSLSEPAACLGIAPKTLQRYECGERKIKVETLKQLCNFYVLDYDNFLREARQKFNAQSGAGDEEEPPYEELQYLLARNGKKLSVEQKMELIKLLSELD